MAVISKKNTYKVACGNVYLLCRTFEHWEIFCVRRRVSYFVLIIITFFSFEILCP